ncbi:integrase core domain-containing protein [Umezawaea endophytica]|uniref:Integrase core domain-containing protein n=1 Tax=Umezawaea endophytica TaxID=1654476 RepID=A0A9X2VX38_9PSEU|nr:integrase core domain-containing protein [Umezawaea endophytica]MCS7483729.1 integrase core domain-containing protein [Umezawaea endophytica]
MWQTLKNTGIDPASDRTSTTWADFLRSRAKALLACDFFKVPTLSGTHLYVLAVIKHSSRRIRVLGATAHSTAAWVAQASKNLVMDLHDAGNSARFLNRDRDRKFLTLFDVILADVGIQIVLSGVRIPQMNSIMERWIQSCRHELLDHTLIWNQRHLLHALREYEQFHNTHRPHHGIANARPCTRCHHRVPIMPRSATLTSADYNGWAASSTNTTTQSDQHGCSFRQAQRCSR